MNFFQLILKQMRQRALSTVLTTLSIMLGVGLAVAILVLQRESGALFGQRDYGYEVLAGVKGSALQLTVNTVYRIDTSPGNVKYGVYENLLKQRVFRQDVRIAIPQCVGDSYQGQPIVGTVPQYFGYDDAGQRVENDPDPSVPRKRFEYKPGQSFEIAAGKPFHADKFEAVVGSEAAQKTGLKVGDTFQATHGFPQPGQTPDVHDEKWTVVGVLAPTQTAADKCVYIGLTSFYTIFEHADAEIERDMVRRGVNPATQKKADEHDHDHDGHADHEEHEHKHYTQDPDGTIRLDKEVLDAREVSAILIKARDGYNALHLIYNLNLQPDVMAVNPAGVMRDFFANFVKGPTLLLLVIAVLVIVVASVGVLTAIYNSVASRSHEIAVLRALGATKNKILLLIAGEATLLGVLGGGLGFLLGHALAGGGSAFMRRAFGEGLNWANVSPAELALLAGVVVLALLAGLVPALKAYRVPVATNLVGQ